ncbi:adenosine receptor A2a-like [Oculina patagonica]
MNNPICKETLPLIYPADTEAKDLHSWYIANCVLNALLAITAIVFNGVTIQALRRTSSVPKPLKTLLLNLAVSDLGVGLLVEPLYFGMLVSWARGNDLTGFTCTTHLIISYLFAVPSFLGVMSLSVDRFLAIHLPLRYIELVTHKRVVAVVISIWVFSLSLSLFRWLGSRNVTYAFIAIIVIVSFALSAVLYCKIYLAVRRHRNHINALQVQQVAESDEMTNFARLRNSALDTFYVYHVFVLCYLPHICARSFLVVKISALSTGVKAFSICAATLLLLNLSLNPVIYCWKIRHIRQAIMDILRRNIFPSHN